MKNNSIAKIKKILKKIDGKIIFRGRKSKKDEENVQLFISKEFLDKFSIAMKAELWGAPLHYLWGKNWGDDGNRRMEELTIYPPETGGSVLQIAAERLEKEINNALSILHTDRGYKKIEIKGVALPHRKEEKDEK